MFVALEHIHVGTAALITPMAISVSALRREYPIMVAACLALAGCEESSNTYVEPPPLEMALKYPVEVWISCGEDFVKPESTCNFLLNFSFCKDENDYS